MKNKKLIPLVLLSFASISLTGCGTSEAVAKPSIYDDKLVNTGDITIDHNSIAQIYDSIHDNSSTPSDIRNELEKILATAMFGEYKVVKSTTSGAEKALITLVGYDDKTDSEKVEFINKHHYYQDRKADGNQMVYQTATAITPTIEARISLFKEIIYKEVINKLFSEANTSTYKYRGKFEEKKFARAINEKFMSSSLENNGFIDVDNDNDWFSGIVVDYTYDVNDPTTIDGRLLHVSKYCDYINSQYMPSIMETLLTEQYIYDEIYSTIGRTNARQVSYIKLSADNILNDPLALIKKFADKYILDEKTVNKETSIDYTILQEAYKGDVFKNDSISNKGKELLESLKDIYPLKNEDFTYIDGKNQAYYFGTKFAGIYEDYSKITYDSKTNDDTLYNNFTGTKTYAPEIGLQMKLNDLRALSYAKKDIWGTKDKGFSDLSDYSSRLFDYTLNSNIHSDPNELETSVGNIVKYINGHYFLLPESYDKNDKYNFILKNGTTYTIIEIKEGITQAYIDPTQTNITDSMELFNTIEKSARIVGYTLAGNDTYKNTALTHYLKKSSIKYYDTSVYDYFKKNLPDLFKD